MFFDKVIKTLNIDQDILYSLALKFWSLIKTPLSFYFITQYLTIDEQGYWYTFLSLGALSVFAELGFTTIISQYISHEIAHLSVDKQTRISGPELAIDKLISLIKYTFKVYSYMVPVGVIILAVVGTIFFSTNENTVYLILPWIIYAITGGLTLLISYFGALIQGLDKVKEVLKINLISGILSVASIWVGLYFGLKLWSLSVGGFVLISTTLLLYKKQSGLLYTQVTSYVVSTNYNWFKEIMPLQIRYSLSWTSSYFVFYFMVPTTMYFLGAEDAGKLGISVSITTAMLHLAHSWVSTKTPLLNMLVSRGDFVNMENKFKSLNLSSIIVFVIISIFLLLFYNFIFPLFNITDRFLSFEQLLILLFAELPKLVYGNIGVYLRAFKKEPLLYVSISTALLTVVALVFGLYFYESMTIGLIMFMLVQYISLFAGALVFKNFKIDKVTDQVYQHL